MIPTLGERRLDELTPLLLTKLYGALLQTAKRRQAGLLSPRTVRFTHVVLKRARRRGPLAASRPQPRRRRAAPDRGRLPRAGDEHLDPAATAVLPRCDCRRPRPRRLPAGRDRRTAPRRGLRAALVRRRAESGLGASAPADPPADGRRGRAAQLSRAEDHGFPATGGPGPAHGRSAPTASTAPAPGAAGPRPRLPRPRPGDLPIRRQSGQSDGLGRGVLPPRARARLTAPALSRSAAHPRHPRAAGRHPPEDRERAARPHQHRVHSRRARSRRAPTAHAGPRRSDNTRPL